MRPGMLAVLYVFVFLSGGVNMIDQLSGTAAKVDSLSAVIQEIVAGTQCERRAEQRYPYFAPVTITTPDAPLVKLSAYAKDISLSGLGMVHVMKLARGPALITLPLQSGRLVTINTDICWCRDFGSGWYISGGRFLEIVQ
jgi:hypothetical protein